MNVSPDLPAYWCYLVVLLLGFVTAGTQVSAQLGNLPGKWLTVNTWLLFFAYTLIPLGLFWLLDRTNAIHDTSVFAAVLVGVGYQQILSGSFATLKAPGDVSIFLKPFAAWSAAITVQIRDRVAIRDGQFDENLLSTIVNDPGKFDALKQVVMVHVADPLALDASLAAIAANRAVLGDIGVHTRQAQTLYMNLKQASPQQFQYLLRRDGIISRGSYLWYARGWRSWATAIVVCLILLGGAGVAAAMLRNTSIVSHYFLWRLDKSNDSDVDRFRAEKRLGTYLANEPSVCAGLAEMLTAPNLADKTEKAINSILIANWDKTVRPDDCLRDHLADSLRMENSDMRARLQKTLVYLAASRHLSVPPALANWQPDAKDGPADIDAEVKLWKQVKP
jgi:hypothetical protein